MHPQLQALFDEAENRYLKPQELSLLSQYVSSLPARLDAYRTLRDRELEVMQRVADQLQAEMPQEEVATLERSIKNALLVLRYCSMGMLLNDETFVQTRLLNWLSQSMNVYHTQRIDQTLYRLLNQFLTQALNANQMSLLQPQIKLAQDFLLQQPTP